MWPASIKDWLEAIFYLVTIIAVVASGYNYWRNSRRDRTRWLFELYQRFYTSPELQDIFSQVDWGETSFVKQEDRKLLPKLDELLNFFEFVAILYYRNELGRDEVVAMFDYPLRRIAKDSLVLAYLHENGYEQLDALLKDLRYAS